MREEPMLQLEPARSLADLKRRVETMTLVGAYVEYADGRNQGMHRGSPLGWFPASRQHYQVGAPPGRPRREPPKATLSKCRSVALRRIAGAPRDMMEYQARCTESWLLPEPEKKRRRRRIFDSGVADTVAAHYQSDIFDSKTSPP